MAGVTPSKMIGAVVFVFVIALLGAAFTPVLQTQVNNWGDNLTAEGQDGAATVVGLIPLLFRSARRNEQVGDWILLAIGMILTVVDSLLPGKFGL